MSLWALGTLCGKCSWHTGHAGHLSQSDVLPAIATHCLLIMPWPLQLVGPEGHDTTTPRRGRIGACASPSACAHTPPGYSRRGTLARLKTLTRCNSRVPTARDDAKVRAEVLRIVRMHSY